MKPHLYYQKIRSGLLAPTKFVTKFLQPRRALNLKKLDKDKKTGTMKIRDKRKENEYQVIVKALAPDFLSVRMPIMSVKQNVAHYLLVSTQQHVPSFLFDLASKLVPESSEFEILSHD